MPKILAIEDEDHLREEVLELLSLEGFEVLGAENGQVGVQLAQKHQPDLILCDVNMPLLDGYGVLTRLRENSTTAMIPFIFLTARAEKADLRRGMTLGADDYLPKPFTRKELLAAIATQFRKRDTLEHQSQKQLEQLRSNITLSLPHELHTPLAGIIGMSELLIAEYGTIEPEEGLEMLEIIHSSAERLYRLTQNFLLYAELELIATNANRIAAQCGTPATTDAQAVIAEVAKQKAKQADRSADLQLVLQSGTVSIVECKLKKIVEEVIDNAFKFSQPSSPVCVSSVFDQDTFSFSVIDQGRGLTPEQIANIGAYMQFERKLHEQQGSGLGLIIAKRITELHGGELTIESNPGKQTIVRVTLKP